MANKVRPIKPSEVAKGKIATFPDAVFEAFNELISVGFTNGSVTIKQDEVVKLMEEKGLNHLDIFDNGWLNVEEAYEAEGWEVEYDQPGFRENYPATFKFTC
jgi:hypothetical protein